jgi:outer membrane receptor protein involved in Fe transport
LIRIITNQPVLDREEGMIAVTTAATEHGAPSGGVDAMVNVPIVDNILGVRLVGYVKRDGGYINDARLNLRDINQTDTSGGRLTLLWQPFDDWTVTAGVTNQLIDAADSQYAQGNLSPLTRANYEREPHRDAFLQSSLTIEGSFDWANVTSTTAFTKRRIAAQLDATLAWQALTGYRTGPSTFDDVRRIQSVTHETRLTSTGKDDFSWIAGIFISHRDEDYHSVLTGPDAARAPFQARVEARTDHADEDALFGEATYRVFDFLSVTGGARLYHSTLDAAGQVGQPTLGNNVQAQGQNRVTGVIPKVIVSVNPADNLTFYADATEGFRLGGVNINSPIGAINVNRRKARLNVNPNATAFDSDRLWSYEVGAKTSFFDRTLVVNAAAYYTVWDGIQSDQILRDGSLYTSNAGGAHVPGFEVDLDMRVTQHLRLQGNFFWNNPQILHGNPLLVQSVGRLPAVAKSNLGLSGRYDIPLGGDWNASTRLEYSYVGPSTLGFDALHSPGMGDYFIGNIRLGLTHDSWEAVVFMNNIANEQANTFAFGNPFSLTAASQITPLRPRTLGISLSASY